MSTIMFDPIKTQSRVTDSVIVAFSGGKDSIVTLDLCCRYFKNVKAFFMYMIPDLSFQERTIRWYEKKYDIEILRLPHMDLSTSFRYGCFRGADYSVPAISINDVYSYVRQKYGIWWIAAGERINDSLIRRAMIKHSGSIDVQRGRFYPISGWNKKEVMEYIKFHKLKMGEDSKKLGFSFKSFEGRELYMIKTNYPKDYEKILHIFPFAEASVRRFEEYGKEQISEL